MYKKLYIKNSKLNNLINRLVNYNRFKITIRNMDFNWTYKTEIGFINPGFTPFRFEICLPRYSKINQFVNSEISDPRDLNESDHFTREYLFLIHDLIHLYAYQVIAEQLNQETFWLDGLTFSNIEDYVFCHILTETAATVGLDYWILTQYPTVNDLLPIGTNMESLTVGYHSKYKNEYLAFYEKRLNIKSAPFFSFINHVYCLGDFPGFSLCDFNRSNIIKNWTIKEVKYGALQRKYAREWMQYFLGRIKYKNESELNAPLCIDKSWKKKLIQVLQKSLWNLINTRSEISKNCENYKSFEDRFILNSPYQLAKDPRFRNLKTLSDILESIEKYEKTQPQYIAKQIISRLKFEDLNLVDKKKVIESFKSGNLSELIKIYQNSSVLLPFKNEADNIFMIA